LEAIRAIRANPAIPDTLSIIMVTAYNRDELLAQAADLEHLGVLEKPVTPSSVFDAIAESLRDSASPAQHPAQGGDTPSHAARLKGAEVLLVEDNLVNQEVAEGMLAALGVGVTVAANGQQALDILDRRSFDAVLMDCQMPVLDGYEATRRIRADGRFATLPVLAMTANAMSGDEQLCRAAGMNAHIAKPIDLDILAATLAHWIAPAAGDAGAGPALEPSSEVAALPLQEMMATFAVQFDAALEQEDQARARRLIHRLRGDAARFGASALDAAAAALVEGLDAGEAPGILRGRVMDMLAAGGGAKRSSS
ncbi:MAG: response regulator, partial [Telluria sp.]